MRLSITLLAMLLVCSFALSQKRYLVSSAGDVVLVGKGQSAAEVVRKQTKVRNTMSAAATCIPAQEYGNIPALHSSGQFGNFTFGHKDLIACWFEAPASGAIDSVFVSAGNAIGDTLTTGGKLILRIHHSNLTTGHAPGWAPYIAPPRVCWGYFNNSFDLDAGLAAFPDDASDTTWISAYNLNNGGGTYTPTAALNDHYGDLADTSLKSFPPAAEEIWGLGGVEVPVKLNSISGISLGTLPPKPEVEKGYPFFVTFRVPGASTPSGHPVDPGTAPPFTEPTRVVVVSNAEGVGGDPPGAGDPNPLLRRQFHLWKFYEHPSFCGAGWLGRGGFSIFIWYSMVVTSDIAPNIMAVDNIGHTTDEIHARTVQADIEDCNFAPGGTSGVASAKISYALNGSTSYTDVSMSNLGGTIWQGEIPAFPCGTSVNYRVSSTDNNGNTSDGALLSYQVLCMRSNWFAADTGATRTYNNALSSDGGTPIDTGSFFGARSHTGAGGANTINKDDGTAGPFALSNGFVFFGDTMHFAWVGVNGGIALSKTATDTINLNAGGPYSPFTFPTRVRLAYPDTTNEAGAPRNFIGGMWSDLICGDTLGQYGHVYHKDDANHFIAEWDSLGNFNTTGTVLDEEVFRIVLNKADGTIEFQMDNVGVNGLDSNSVIAVQSDSSNPNQQHGYLMINNNTFPIETKPRNNWTIKYWPVTAVAVADGWNMLSAPGSYVNLDKTTLYTKASSNAFAYSGGYQQAATLTNGTGYWLKYSGAQTAQVPSAFVHSASIPLNAKWNMIGSVTSPVAKSSLTTTPSGQINTAVIYGYNGSYSAASSTIDPGKGYWVKALANCTLNMSATAAAPKAQPVDDFNAMNEIAVGSGSNLQSLYLAPEGSLKNSIDAYELPPAVPNGFDARFASGRQVETYTNSDAQYRIDLTNSLSNATSAVTVKWSMKNAPEGRTFTMTDGDNGKVLGKVILQGSGSVRIENGAVKTLIIKAESGINVPATFALSQNYPNPFNPTTRMQLDVPQTGQVTVAVFDVLGRKVATLVDGVTEAGYHVIEWNGMNSQGMSVPTGTYFVRINAGEFTQVRKIMMMK